MTAEEIFQQRIRLGRLYDMYGELLTERQKKLLQLYFYDDLSLSEISEEAGVSRQAVHDLLRRVEQTLERYEERLGFMERTDSDMKKLALAVQLLERKDKSSTERAAAIIREMCGEGR